MLENERKRDLLNERERKVQEWAGEGVSKKDEQDVAKGDKALEYNDQEGAEAGVSRQDLDPEVVVDEDGQNMDRPKVREKENSKNLEAQLVYLCRTKILELDVEPKSQTAR